MSSTPVFASHYQRVGCLPRIWERKSGGSNPLAPTELSPRGSFPTATRAIGAAWPFPRAGSSRVVNGAAGRAGSRVSAGSGDSGAPPAKCRPRGSWGGPPPAQTGVAEQRRSKADLSFRPHLDAIAASGARATDRASPRRRLPFRPTIGPGVGFGIRLGRVHVVVSPFVWKFEDGAFSRV